MPPASHSELINWWAVLERDSWKGMCYFFCVIRAFVAIEISEDVRTALGEAQLRLKQSHPAVKVSWAKIGNLHLTLQFLGSIAESTVPRIAESLANAISTVSVFDVPVAGVGAFPDIDRPRVLWIGCQDPARKLRTLAQSVQAALRTCGFQPEPVPWVAHFTLGRIRSPRPDPALTGALDSLTNEVFGTLRVAEIHLFESQLQPDGSVYTKRSSHSLPPVA